MAETKSLEREYIIPLRRAWLRVPVYERTGRAVKAIKIFIAKHMKVIDRDTDRVKLDPYFNNELWFRGRANPPSKIRVKAKKEGDIVNVTFAETPQYVKFLQAKHLRFHKKAEEKPAEMKEQQAASAESEAKKTEEPQEEVKIAAEKEKEKAVAEQSIKQAEQQAKAQKHLTRIKEPKIQRMALKK